MSSQFLYEKLDILKEVSVLTPLPQIIEKVLSPKILLREYQIDAFKNFVAYFENENLRKNKQIHTLFHIRISVVRQLLWGLILYLYTKGYRKFLFFVNQTNVLEKTIDNFTNTLSSKYLFDDTIEHLKR
ncbi:DEAD/DEAH box helicase family protein [Mycoplasmopsis cynos]|nr:DEAD/DEAH box helicase family protein [Mycoplasmopsis cynos]